MLIKVRRDAPCSMGAEMVVSFTELATFPAPSFYENRNIRTSACLR